jgi:hypothetical protein
MNYSFNIIKLIKDYLGVFNKPKIKAYTEALIFSVVATHTDFLAFRVRMLSEVTITSEVNRLRKALRDRFVDQTIQIIHPGDYLLRAFIFLRTEPRPVRYDYLREENHLPTEYDYLRNEYDASVDFIVRIPLSLANRSDEIYNYVLKYKIASIKFKVEAL